MAQRIKHVSLGRIVMVLVQRPQAYLGVPRRVLKIQPVHLAQPSVHVMLAITWMAMNA